MGWLSVVIAVVAAVLLFCADYLLLGTVAILAGLGSFLSWMGMHRFAQRAARRRINYSGGFYDITAEEAEEVPDWIARVNMGFSLLGAVLLIFAFVLPEHIPPWGKWALFVLGYFLLFILWSHVPMERFDRHLRWMNPIGRPMLNTLVLTGLPALYAHATDLPVSWILVPLTFVCTQYAVLVGRVIVRYRVVAGIVSLTTTVLHFLKKWHRNDRNSREIRGPISIMPCFRHQRGSRKTAKYQESSGNLTFSTFDFFRKCSTVVIWAIFYRT